MRKLTSIIQITAMSMLAMFVSASLVSSAVEVDTSDLREQSMSSESTKKPSRTSPMPMVGFAWPGQLAMTNPRIMSSIRCWRLATR